MQTLLHDGQHGHISAEHFLLSLASEQLLILLALCLTVFNCEVMLTNDYSSQCVLFIVCGQQLQLRHLPPRPRLFNRRRLSNWYAMFTYLKRT